MKSRILKISSLILPFFVLTFPGFRQDFEVAPVRLNYNCEPGQIQTKVVTVRNHGNQKQQFVLIASDLVMDSLGNKVRVTDKMKVDNSCKDWITMNPAFFDLNPNESKEIKVVLQVPPGKPETRWSVIYVTAADEQTSMAADKNMKAGVKVKPRIAIRVVQSPASNTNVKAAISNLAEITQASDSVRMFHVKISNTGEKMIDAKVYLVLSNLETAKEIKAKAERISVFPGNVRIMKLQMPPGIPPGKYSMAAILDYGGNSTLEAVQMNVEVK
jgi:hypothetical protein